MGVQKMFLTSFGFKMFVCIPGWFLIDLVLCTMLETSSTSLAAIKLQSSITFLFFNEIQYLPVQLLTGPVSTLKQTQEEQCDTED